MGMPALATDVGPARRVIVSKTQIFVITANKGGVGKTTLSFSLAVAAAYDGYKVAIIDLDKQHASLFLSEVRKQRQPNLPQVDVLPYEFDQAERALRETLSKGYDLVFVDSPPGVEGYERHVKALVDRADMVLVPTGAGILELRACAAWLAGLKADKARDIAFILNKVKGNTVSAREARAYVGKKGRVCDGQVRNLDIIESSQKKGLTVFDLQKASAREDMDVVWHYAKQEKNL